MYKSVSERPRYESLLPDKLFYKIGEVSKIMGVEPYVLRYWEVEFPFVKPRKNKSGQRVYIKRDVELLIQIKRLLYNERYTIEGVRKRLGNTHIHPVDPNSEMETSEVRNPSKVIEHVKKRLREILNHFD
jgi:DNA-binding transcriptional MerR regulator